MDIGFSVCNTQIQCLSFLALFISINYPFIPAFLLSIILAFTLVCPFLKHKGKKVRFSTLLRVVLYLGLAFTILGYLLIYFNSIRYENNKAINTKLKKDYDNILITEFIINDAFFTDGTFKVKLDVPYSGTYIVDMFAVQGDKQIAYKSEKDVYIKKGVFTIDSGVDANPNNFEPIELIVEIGTNDLPEIIFPGKEHPYFYTGIMFYSSQAMLKGRKPCFSRIRNYICINNDKLHLPPISFK